MIDEFMDTNYIEFIVKLTNCIDIYDATILNY